MPFSLLEAAVILQRSKKLVRNGELNAEIVLIVTNKPDAYVVERAEKAGIRVAAFRPKEFDNERSIMKKQFLDALHEAEAEWLVLAGYMRLVGHTLLAAYPSRIVNIHPSLLPSFPGKDAVGQAIEHGVKVTGVTVHLSR